MTNYKSEVTGDRTETGRVQKRDSKYAEEGFTKENYLLGGRSNYSGDIIHNWFFSQERKVALFQGGYPYTGAVFLPAVLSSKGRNSKIVGILLGIFGFLVALKSVSGFGQAVKYNVYGR